jgi:transposase-like protein
MKAYDEGCKESMIQKMLSPGGKNPCALAREVGIPQQTLSRWKREYSKLPSMSKKTSKPTKDWSAEDKLRAILETQDMGEAELGEYLRQKGLYSAELEEWKSGMLAALQPTGRGRPKKDPEVYELRQKNQQLERALRRNEKALAEASALLVLKKKAALIWGELKDDESE